ncbi:ATP-binding protein [Marinobacter lacisalsi]|uniref:histidine kinase n=1 Tax=Marinobacter lacisalsi TaxID=475979 RepID=A0ABV8QNE8_9GAMM
MARVVFLLIVLCQVAEGHAATSTLTLGPDLSYRVIAEDGKPLSFQEVRQKFEEADAGPYQTDIFSAGYSDTTYWLTFHLPQKAFAEGKRLLRLAPTYLDHVRVHYREVAAGDAPWRIYNTGDLSPMPRGDLDYRFAVIELPVPDAGRGYEFLIRVQSTSATLLHATFWSEASFANSTASADSFWGFYFGLAIFSSTFALYLALVFSSRLLWAVFSFSVSYVLVACIQGYIDWLSPLPSLHLQHYLTSTSVMLSYPVLIWMAAESIRLREHLPVLYRYVTRTAFAMAFILLSIPLGFFGQGMAILVSIYLVLVLVLLVSTGYVIWVERFRLSTLLLAAGPLILMGVSGIALSSAFGFIRFNANIYLIWQYMLVVNMMLAIGITVARIVGQKREQADKEKLALELDIEREARFHQRQFMGLVSHEFRTPLSIISATLQNLEGGEVQSEALAMRYRKMSRAIDRLIQLTDNCLADARLAAQSLYVDRQPTLLHVLVHSAAAIVGLSERHQLRVTVDGLDRSDTEVFGPTVLVDTALMKIALSNVLDNAVKYSEGGVVHLDCRTGRERLTMSVIDQGCGISESEAPYVFEQYHRVSAGGGSGRQGVGLGLFVARQIAESHGGKLELTDSGAEGCRFEFTIPFREESDRVQ